MTRHRAKLTALLERFVQGNWAGVHFAVNVFLATTILWLVLRKWGDLNPVWAISSMIAASDPQVKEALKTFRGRIINAVLGCAVGLVFLFLGHTEFKLPVALAVTVLLSSYVVRVQVMWRQAPITAAIVIAAGFEKQSELTAIETGLRRVGEVLLGCVVGVAVSWIMSKLWALPEKHEKPETPSPTPIKGPPHP